MSDLKKISYIGASTSHGGVIAGGISRNVYVDVGGSKTLASINGDIHVCPRHGVNCVIATGFAKFNEIRHTRVGDSCACGAAVVSGSDNTWSEGDI
jgi:uncharacterized Zn-binding protein involved in type VI secretion